MLFAFSPSFAVSMVMVALAGGSLMAYDVTMGTMLQLLSYDEMRGRVLGIYGLTFGFTPLGGFLVGLVGTVVGVPVAMGVGAGVIIAYGLRVLRSDKNAIFKHAADAQRACDYLIARSEAGRAGEGAQAA